MSYMESMMQSQIEGSFLLAEEFEIWFARCQEVMIYKDKCLPLSERDAYKSYFFNGLSPEDAIAQRGGTTMTEIEKLQLLLKTSYKQEERLEEIIRELRRTKFTSFAKEECWIYTVGEDNHLESLVCPVVISADVLSKFESILSRMLEAHSHSTVDWDAMNEAKELLSRRGHTNDN